MIAKFSFDQVFVAENTNKDKKLHTYKVAERIDCYCYKNCLFFIIDMRPTRLVFQVNIYFLMVQIYVTFENIQNKTFLTRYREYKDAEGMFQYPGE